MKNLIIIILIAVIIMLISFIYKSHISNIYSNFPLVRENLPETGMKPFYLFFYFHSHDCPSCLEVIQILNNLPRHFCVRGIVPKDEVQDEDKIRKMTGAIFPLVSVEKYKDFIPPRLDRKQFCLMCIEGLFMSRYMPYLHSRDEYLKI